MKKENQEIINDHFNNKRELNLSQKIILSEIIKEEINIGLVNPNDSDSQWRMYVDLLSVFVQVPKLNINSKK